MKDGVLKEKLHDNNWWPFKNVKWKWKKDSLKMYVCGCGENPFKYDCEDENLSEQLRKKEVSLIKENYVWCKSIKKNLGFLKNCVHKIS